MRRMEDIPVDEFFIVMVQDFGEVYEYRYSTLDAAKRFMAIERLPCSLWICSNKDSQRKRLVLQPAN